MTFEKRLRSVSSAAAQRLGIMRKSWQVFHDRSLLLRSFLELCPAGFGVLLSSVLMSFLPFYSNDQVEWSTKNTGLIKVTRLFNKTLS